MDPPYVPHHHHPRYVPYSPPPPPPPPAAPFDPSPNFYASRHHNPHLPPPPPPPQQQLSYQARHSHPPPPQPPPQRHAPYNPHHPQITYNPSFNPNPQFSDFSHRSTPDSPHVSRRDPELDTRLDYWPGNRQSWAQQAPNLDRESHHTQFDVRSGSPVNRYRHGFEGSSRIRNEYSEGFKLESGERDDFVRLQVEYGVRDRSSEDFGVGSSKYELGFGKGDGRYDSSFDREMIRVGTTAKFRESARWVHDRQTLNGNEINNRDVLRIGSRKYDYQDSAVEIYDDRGRREGIYEFNRTPRKQIQKKSALLRIQIAKPSHKSREDERSHYFGYSNEMKSNSFRLKDQAVQSGNRMEPEEREGSPVELDVSFKSNALVAKAITPPSSSTVASDTNLTPNNSKVRKVLAVDKVTSVASQIDSDICSTPWNSKIRRALEIDKDNSNSPQKVNEARARLDGSAVVSNRQCSEKNTTQSEGRATSSVSITVENNLTRPSSEKVKFSLKSSKTKRSQKAAAPSDGFSNGKNGCPVYLEDLNRPEKIHSSSIIRDGGINCATQPNSSVFNAAGKESLVGGPPKRSDSVKVVANLGKTSTRSSISGKVNENPGKTIHRSTVSDKVASNPGKTSSRSTLSDRATPGKISPKRTILDKAATNPGQRSPKNINSVNKTSSRSTTLDKVASNQANTLTKNIVSGKIDDNTSKTPYKSTISGKVDSNPDKTSSVKIVKKKKVVRKVIKKVTGKPLCLPNAKVARSSDKPLCSYSSPRSLPGAYEGVMPVEKGPSSANLGSDGGSAHHVSEAAKLLPDNKEGDGSFKGMALQEIGNPESVIHKKRKILQSVGSLSNIEGKVDENFMDDGDSILRRPSFSSVQDGRTEAIGEIISCGSVSVPIVDRLHDLGAMNFDSGLLKSEKKEVHDEIFGTRSSYAAVNISVNFDPSLLDSEKKKSDCVSELGLSNLEEINKFHENSTLDASKHTSVYLHSQVNDSCNKEALTEITTNPSNSDEAEVGSASLPADCTNYGVGTLLTPEISSINLGTIDGEPDDGSCGLLSRDGLVENSGRTGPSNARASAEDLEENASTDRNRKRKLEIPVVESPISLSPGVRLGSVAEGNSVKCVATLSLSDENFHPTDKVVILDGRSPMETLHEVQSGIELCGLDGLQVDKKQKLSTSSLSPAASLISEVPAVGQLSAPDVQLQTRFSIDLLHSSQDVKVSKLDAKCAARVDSFSDNMELDTPHCLYHSSSGLESYVSSLQFSAQNNHRTESAYVEVVGKEATHGVATDDQPIGFVDATKCRIASPHQSADGVGRLATTSMVERLAPASTLPSDECFPVNKDASLMCTLSGKESPGQNSEPDICRDGKLPDQRPHIDGAATIPYSDSAKMKTRFLPSHVPKYTSPASGQMVGRRNQIVHPVPKSYPGRNVFVASRNMTSATNIPKSRTWHRGDNSSTSLSNKPSLNKAPPHTQMSYKVVKAETSYIRKGNSLVRKASSVPALCQETRSLSSSVYQLNSVGLDEVGKVSGSESRADVLDSANSSRTVGIDAPPGVVLSPAMPGEITSENQPNDSSSNSISGLIMEAPPIVLSEDGGNPSSPVEINHVVESSKGWFSTSGTTNENSSANNLESLNEQNESAMISSNAKRMRYIKPKSNQLVATSNLSCASVHIAENNQSSQPDGYYKRSKNQLIRTTMEGTVKQSISTHGSKVNAAGKMASGAFGKRQPHKVLGKIHKLSRFSLVWTLKNALLSNPGGQSCYPKFIPQLFPWKRVSYRRSLLSSNRNSYLSLIGHKLLLLRKRKTVYTRSNNGFSLRKSKVLSVGGSSLKWSKSIERRSKKANEEAAMAVAEAERKRREQNSTACSTPMPKNRGHSSSCRVVHDAQLRRGERIFRIGSMRYKMDSSRRTLQRISEDEVTCSTDLASGNKENKSYVPRRLLIGNDEYVRIGNGNQLVRDPKKRTRVLASEKVRWSLHTARQRLVKKRKYCQFFTRFGKCNKDNGKCPYIHDPSKVAVCTKFLKGLCSNPICKLTHKVIPERMPDCSYFLQGLCTNEICPYRHVHVNPNASTCEGFLRGYCADGNECRKKHSYVCPAFEATGSCPQGSKCKLHHPKKRLKEKRSKYSREQWNARGRYFGSVHIDVSEPMKVSEKRMTEDTDDSEVEGELGDFISIDVSNEEDLKSYDAAFEQAAFGENDCLDLDSEDIDELIRPVRIMDKNLST